MKSRNRLVAASIIAALGLTVAACGDDDDTGDTGDTTAEEQTDETGAAEGTEDTGAEDTSGDTAAEDTSGDTATEDTSGGDGEASGEGVNVGLLFDVTGRGDKSFNDAAAAGLDRATEELGINPSESSPAGEGDRRERLNVLADAGNELIIGVGFLWTDDLAAGAEANPDINFAIIDSVVEADNVASLTFAEHQGSFLVGAAAAMTTEADHIGFVGGVPNDLIKKFEAGYVAGAQHVNPDIDIEIEYVSEDPAVGFNDPTVGKELGAAMYEAGADVVYHAAGASGDGVFEAASEAGEPGEVWAIGVDSDQYEQVSEELQPYILTSMLKRVDVAVYDTIESMSQGAFEGGVQVYDLSVDGVGYSTSGGFVDDIAGDLDELKQQIIDGDIEVPEAP